MAVQILSACREAPCPGPSEIRALDFKREFPRSAICSISASIDSNRSIFSLRPPPASYRRFQKRPSAAERVTLKAAVLSSGDPQIAGADGDAPVLAYIAAMPGWRRGVGTGSTHSSCTRSPACARLANGTTGPIRGWFLSWASLVYWPAPSRPLPAKARTGNVAARPGGGRGRLAHGNVQLRFALLPEYPDITLYIEHLRSRIRNEALEEVRLASPFFLRSVDVPIGATKGKRVLELRRLGKRIIVALEDDLFLVLRLMIAGRLRWRPRGTKPMGKIALAAFDFPIGTLLVTEASSKKRASLHVVRGKDGLRAHDPGGLEVLEADIERFRDALVRESHTVKRALTDPHLFSGIGNAYSDEILHAARLSPVKLTRTLTDAEDAP